MPFFADCHGRRRLGLSRKRGGWPGGEKSRQWQQAAISLGASKPLGKGDTLKEPAGWSWR